jgi:hypothetical protein
MERGESAVISRLCLAIISAALVFVANIDIALADDEPTASRFVLDFSNVSLQSGERIPRAHSDLSLALNVILGCEFDVLDDRTQISDEDLSVLEHDCPRTVAKWDGPVTFWMGHNSSWLRDYSGTDVQLIGDVLIKAGSFVGLTFEPVSYRSSSNMEILFFDAEEKEEERERLTSSDLKPALLKATRDFLDGVYEGRCKAMWKTNEVGVVEKYRLLVDSEISRPDREAYLADCLVRAMGLRSNYAAHHVIGIATNPSGEEDRLYGVLPDALRALELLYEPQMSTGMTASEVFKLY